ncbi:MAG: diguanylate cyclase [Chakrabartia sp.]
MIRSFIVALLLLLCVRPAYAEADAARFSTISLGEPCLLQGAATANPETLITQPQKFSCTLKHGDLKSGVHWARFQLPRAIDSREVEWHYSHAVTQADSEHLWVGTKDGRVLKIATEREAARRILGGSSQVFDLPAADGINSLLVRVEGLENRRGSTPRAALISAPVANKNLMITYLIFGILSGAMAGIMFYNLTLYGALRYPVLLSYVSLIFANLVYGVVWSNAILYFLPTMTTAMQFNVHALSIAVCFAAGGLFFTTFLEDGMLPRWAGRLIHSVNILGLLVQIGRFFMPPNTWQLTDTATYICFVIALLMTIIGSAIALKRGSIAVRYYLLAWSLPFIVIMARVLWGVGLVKTESALFEASNFVVVSIEALLSSVGLAWRLKQLRTERDGAQIRADEMYQLATIDPLTGLLNRRAFLDRSYLAAANGQDVQLILIDIDRFKFVNDGFGHHVGDTVLCHVADAIRASGMPMIGRLGGDEFAILIAGGNAVDVGKFVRKKIAVSSKAVELAVTVSIGLAAGPLRNEQDWQLLYVAADQALYRSKRGGRDRVTDGRVPRVLPAAA